MSFEVKIRERISKAPFRSTEKDILKVVLGEVQQRGQVNEDVGEQIVKKLIEDNNIVLSRLAFEDVRRNRVKEENEVLQSLLPRSLTEAEIEQRLNEGGKTDAIKTAPKEGPAIGIATSYLKGLNMVKDAERVLLDSNKIRAVVLKLRG